MDPIGAQSSNPYAGVARAPQTNPTEQTSSINRADSAQARLLRSLMEAQRHELQAEREAQGKGQVLDIRV